MLIQINQQHRARYILSERRKHGYQQSYCPEYRMVRRLQLQKDCLLLVYRYFVDVNKVRANLRDALRLLVSHTKLDCPEHIACLCCQKLMSRKTFHDMKSTDLQIHRSEYLHTSLSQLDLFLSTVNTVCL